tara:strand:+ start:8388 stop:9404 length:1017 start_codon:yes stop_codon:yes gene_type:complete
MLATAPYARLAGLATAEKRYGPQIHKLAPWFGVGDTSWDLASPPHRVEAPPWLDAKRCDRGGLVLRRHGVFASMVLRAYALPLSYLSPVGIRPLVASGELLRQAAPRLLRTANYVVETHQQGAMHPGGPGWQTAASVRTIHQRIRQRLIEEGWPEEFGDPIPQADVAVTALLFGPLTVKGLRMLGMRISPQEADDVAHLSRAIAYSQGVVAELHTDTHNDAIDLFERMTSLNGPADDDGRALMRALLDIPYTLAKSKPQLAMASLQKSFYEGLTAELLGDAQAKALGLAKNDSVIRRLRRITQTPGLFHPRLAPVHDQLIQSILKLGEARMQALASAT